MTTATGGEAVVATLEAFGVTHVFGIVSIHNIPIFDAVGRSETIQLVECRHEQGALHAADGYARAAGRIGVCITSTGPGAANAMGGLFEAYYASSPVLMITGQVETEQYGRDVGAVHQADKQIEMLRTVTRRAEHVDRRSDIVPALVSVISDMTAGRPRPGAVEIPIDLQHAVGEDEIPEPQPVPADGPSPASVESAAEILRGARRPLIVAGGGVIAADASTRLTELAEQLDAPVFTSVEGRGAIDEDHPLSLGPNLDLSAMDPVLAAADVVLAVGTRFQQNNNVAKWLTLPGRLIHLDADPGVIGLVHEAEVALVGDARSGLSDLIAAVPAADTEPGWVDSGRARRDEAREASLEACGRDMREIMQAMRAVLPHSAVVVKDATIAAYAWANRLLTVHQPRTAIRPTSLAIGPGVPLAVGAAVASGQPAVVIQGDGGLMLSLGELATAVQARLPLVVCVFNDRGYGILRFIQDLMVEGRRTGVDLSTPEFAPMAAAIGMRSAAVSSAAEFTYVFAKAVDSGEPWLLDIDITTMEPMTIQPQPRPER